MATIVDIAKETGYSLMTISRAFNNPEKVKAETLEVILKTAERLNYYPNHVARSLVNGKTNIINVYIPKELSATEPFVMQTIASIGEKLGEHSYSFLLSRTFTDAVSCDGMILMGMTAEEENMVAQKGLSKPTILYGNNEHIESWVDVDNYNGEKIAVNYLIEKGKKKIAYLGPPLYMHYALERLNGYKDCLKENSIIIDEELIIIKDNNERAGYLATMELISKNKEIDSIVCGSDSMAVGCITALKEKGIDVPQSINVIGYDGFGYEKLVNPRLTTIKQPLFEVGIKIAENLLSTINGDKPQRIKILPILEINESA